MSTLKLPVNRKELCQLEAGTWVSLSGSMLVARDRVHLRFNKAIANNEDLPVDLSNQALLYAGPIIKCQRVIIGPTTASRMDGLTEALFKQGLAVTIGKGTRSKEFEQLAKKYKAAYLMTFGGAAAFLSQFILKAKIIAYGDLGPEALYKIEVRDFPAMVAIDCTGTTVKGIK